MRITLPYCVIMSIDIFTQVLEIMAFKADMRKIMLTCFKHNPAAQKFFKGALKYDIDETCPTDDVYEQFDYEV